MAKKGDITDLMSGWIFELFEWILVRILKLAMTLVVWLAKGIVWLFRLTIRCVVYLFRLMARGIVYLFRKDKTTVVENDFSKMLESGKPQESTME